MSYYRPGGKNVKIKTIRFLGPVTSLFYQNTSSTKKKTEKKDKDIAFTKKVWKTLVPVGTLILTREQKIVAMNGFQCFTRLDTHFQERIKGTENASPIHTLFHR